MSFYRRVADEMGEEPDDDFVAAIEGSCITEIEWEENPDACRARIRGALEEIHSDGS